VTPVRPALAAAVLLAAGACTPAAEKSLKPGQRPDPSSDEAGLWLQSKELERKVRTSGKTVEHAQLTSYVKDTLCRVAKRYCGDIRLYLVRNPVPNAAMYPHGMMTVNTGMLLRFTNEAQLANVLGHEVAHYRERHSYSRIERRQAAMAGAMLSKLAIGMAGVAPPNQLINLIAQGHVLAYSRSQEAEADRVGFRLLKRARYDVGQAAEFWDTMIAEREAADGETPPVFLSTHPPSKQRMAELKTLAREVDAKHRQEPSHGQRYWDHISPHVGPWLDDAFALQRWDRIQFLLDRLREQPVAPGLVQFYQGELYRKRGGNTRDALEALRAACPEPGSPTRCYRSLGMVLWDQDQETRAAQAFEHYLDANPDAGDAPMVRSYIEDLRGDET